MNPVIFKCETFIISLQPLVMNQPTYERVYKDKILYVFNDKTFSVKQQKDYNGKSFDDVYQCTKYSILSKMINVYTNNDVENDIIKKDKHLNYLFNTDEYKFIELSTDEVVSINDNEKYIILDKLMKQQEFRRRPVSWNYYRINEENKTHIYNVNDDLDDTNDNVCDYKVSDAYLSYLNGYSSSNSSPILSSSESESENSYNNRIKDYVMRNYV